jgi:hypothetical protein
LAVLDNALQGGIGRGKYLVQKGLRLSQQSHYDTT